MRTIEDPNRVARLIRNAIDCFELNLNGLAVLTEAASGPFIVTSLTAAMAGARVYAVTRDTPYGSASDVISYGKTLASRFDLLSKIVFTGEPAGRFAHDSDIVTNLGFVRPIDKAIVSTLPSHASISLMWEPWEFRPDDIDIDVCREFDIPVVGTNETDRRLRTFEYVGAVASKLLYESGLEILMSNLCLIASDPFGWAIKDFLEACGAKVTRLALPDNNSDLEIFFGPETSKYDAVILAEHRDARELIGVNGGIDPRHLLENDTRLIHIAGNVDDYSIQKLGIVKYPDRMVSPGYMTVTTDYVGPRPVIDLHTAGLKIGEVMVQARKAGLSVDEAIRRAEQSGLGMSLQEK